jgi:hypothetical protein
MSRITILNNNTIMKNGVVFKVPGQEEGPAKVLPNGKTIMVDTSNHIDKNGNVCGWGCPGADIEDGPLSIEEVIDNIKEESL